MLFALSLLTKLQPYDCHVVTCFTKHVLQEYGSTTTSGSSQVGLRVHCVAPPCL